MRKLFYGTWAFFGKMLNLSSVVFVVGGGGGDCVMFTGSRLLLLLLLVDYATHIVLSKLHHTK